ncbi:MAG: Lin0512 family protein [Pikeienuella sp.]
MKRQMAIEIGTGSDLRGEDCTKAARRAVADALHRNGLTVADALGFPKSAMIVEIRVGVPDPASVDLAAVAEAAPYGERRVEAVEGGLRVATASGATIIANAVVSVSFDMEEA